MSENVLGWKFDILFQNPRFPGQSRAAGEMRSDESRLAKNADWKNTDRKEIETEKKYTREKNTDGTNLQTRKKYRLEKIYRLDKIEEYCWYDHFKLIRDHILIRGRAYQLISKKLT